MAGHEKLLLSSTGYCVHEQIYTLMHQTALKKVNINEGMSSLPQFFLCVK